MRADDALILYLWSIYFIEGQGYVVEELNLHKDNMNDILMENNGKESIKNWTKHIQL